MNKTIIECNDISFSYEEGTRILNNIFLEANENQTIGIIGANGAGKSTLLRILVGLELNIQGKVRINQIEVNKKNLPAIRSEVGYLFQNSDNQLFTQSVYQEIAFGLIHNGLDEKSIYEKVISSLEIVGIAHLKDKKIYKMSGGEKKMVSIASILAMSPKILLLDEPTIALDPKNRRTVINILNRQNHVKLVASHDLDMILDTCESVILMSEGRIICQGPTEEILHNKELLEANGLELPLRYQG